MPDINIIEITASAGASSIVVDPSGAMLYAARAEAASAAATAAAAEAEAASAAATAPSWSTIAGKPTAFPPAPHDHEMADVAGLATALADYTAAVEAKITANNLGATQASNTEALAGTNDSHWMSPAKDKAALDNRVSPLEAVVKPLPGDVHAKAMRFKDLAGRVFLELDPDAAVGLTLRVPLNFPAGSIAYEALNAAAQARLPMSTIDEVVGYLLRVKDQAGRVALAIPKDASSPIEIYGRPLSADAGGALAVETATHLIEQFKDGAGIQQLRAVAKANGTISWSTAAAKSSTGASATPDGKVLFQRGGTTYWVDPAVGVEHLARATSDLILMGDSMTAAGSGYALTMKTAYPSRVVLDAGQPGQRADGIAYRFGTAGLTLAVSGNQIPTSGSVSCTPNYTGILPNTGTVSMRVSVGGVVCNLVSATGAFTLVPVSYPASPVALGSPAQCTVLSTYVTGTDPSGAMSIEQMQSGVVIIRSGRNDVGKSDFSQASVLADIAAMVAAIKPRAKAFFVLGVTNGYGDLPTTLGGNQGSEASSDTILGQISALNTALAAAWGTQFLDPLANHVALGGATNQTVNGHTYAVLNSSVLADGIHENSTGLANTTALVQAAITANGY